MKNFFFTRETLHGLLKIRNMISYKNTIFKKPIQQNHNHFKQHLHYFHDLINTKNGTKAL